MNTYRPQQLMSALVVGLAGISTSLNKLNSLAKGIPGVTTSPVAGPGLMGYQHTEMVSVAFQWSLLDSNSKMGSLKAIWTSVQTLMSMELEGVPLSYQLREARNLRRLIKNAKRQLSASFQKSNLIAGASQPRAASLTVKGSSTGWLVSASEVKEVPVVQEAKMTISVAPVKKRAKRS